MIIELINKEIAEFSKDGKNYTIDFGFKNWGSNVSAQLKLETQEKNIVIVPTCGCTTLEKVIKDYGYDVTLIYDSKRKGNFSKVVKIMANQKMISEVILRGTIL